MKLALLTPNYPPKFCGVGDHSYHLNKHLTDLGHDVTVFTNETSAEPNLQPLTSFGSKHPKEFDLVILQYTPYLYSDRWGRSTLADLMVPWKNKFLFFAHELHYPWQVSFAGTFLSFQHRRLFRKLQTLAKHTIFCLEKPISDPTKESWLPVGSNILPIASVTTVDSMVIHFGGAHPTHEYNLLNEVGKRLKNSFETFDAIPCIGVTENDLKKFGDLPFLKPLGKLSSAEVSKYLNGSKVVLSPFLDGVSTRRGSFMAGLVHGKPVITNLGYSSNPTVPWSRISRLSEHTAESFSAATLELLRQPADREQLGQQALKYYNEHFDWKVIADKLSNRWIKTST